VLLIYIYNANATSTHMYALADIVMRHIKTITTILFLILTIRSFGQVGKRKNYFPIWTFHQDSINIHGISVGLWSFNSEPRFTNTNGIKF